MGWDPIACRGGKSSICAPWSSEVLTKCASAARWPTWLSEQSIQRLQVDMINIYRNLNRLRGLPGLLIMIQARVTFWTTADSSYAWEKPASSVYFHQDTSVSSMSVRAQYDKISDANAMTWCIHHCLPGQFRRNYYRLQNKVCKLPEFRRKPGVLE